MNIVEKIRNGKQFTNQLTGEQDNKITEYKITTKNKTYTLTREQVELLFRLYTKSGANLTADAICSSSFITFTLEDLTTIIAAFRKSDRLKKLAEIFAPHEYEEFSPTERWERKRLFLLEQQKLKDKNNELKSYKDLVNSQRKEIEGCYNFKAMIQEAIDSSKYEPYKTKVIRNGKTLCVWLSDMHIGCRVDTDRATMNENVGWDNDKVIERLNKVLNKIVELGPFESIYVFNLGDALDGVQGVTTRHDVILPQNMSDQEMIKNYINDIVYFFDSMIANECATNYYFRSVGESNHGGPAEYAASLAISAILSSKGIDSYVSSKTFGIVKINNTPVIYLHGKDSVNQSKPLGVILDAKTKEYINSYIATNGLNDYRGNILVVKGDSHQAALTACDDFEYKAVGSLFGSSNWAQANFATRGWEVNMSIFTGDSRLDFAVKDKRELIKPIFN